MRELVVLQFLVPGLVALALWHLRGSPRVARAVAALAAAALLGMAIALAGQVADGDILTYAFGSWRPPYGIVFVADRLSALFVVLQALLLLVTVLLHAPETHGHAATVRSLPLLFLLSCALTAAFLTGDLFNLFVMFELVLMLSFLLQQVPGSPRARQITFPLIVINVLASSFFFVAVGLLYAQAGSVNLAHLSLRGPGGHEGVRLVALGMLLVAFGVKAALVPLLFWLPVSYPALSAPIAALFAGMLTKLGVYALFRTVPLLMADTSLPAVLVGAGALSALLGVLAALAQFQIRRLLGYHIVSQVGYMVFGVGLMTGLGLASALYYTAHHILVKSALYFVADELERHNVSQDLRAMKPSRVAGLALPCCFLLTGLSLAGMPPLSGFIAKLGLFRAAMDQQAWVPLGVLAVASAYTLASMVKVWSHAFQHTPREGLNPAAGPGARPRWPLVGLVGASILVSVLAGPLTAYTDATAVQLLDRAQYVAAVKATPGRAAPDVLGEAE